MKFVVVDVQGYCISSSSTDFYAKELAIYDGKEMKSYLFKPVIPFNALTDACRKQVKHLYANHHGISYSYGELDYEELYSIVCSHLRDVDVIYVKGHIKEKFLVKIFAEIKQLHPLIVNLEFISAPAAASNVPKLDKKPPTQCTYHNLDVCICSVNNAYSLYNYIDSLLPKIK